MRYRCDFAGICSVRKIGTRTKAHRARWGRSGRRVSRGHLDRQARKARKATLEEEGPAKLLLARLGRRESLAHQVHQASKDSKGRRANPVRKDRPVKI
jgi:hypothetical protein